MRRFVCLLSSLLFFVIAASLVATAVNPPSRDRLPLGFESTESDPQVFVARGDGYAMRVSADSVKLWLGPQRPGIGWTLRGIRRGVVAAPVDQLPGGVNYLIGADPTKWRVNVPTYGRIVFRDIYPGIDESFYGNQRELEHDYIVAPKADAKRIHFSISGSDVLESGGELSIREGDDMMRLHRPRAYQVDADGIRRDVAVAYVHHHDGSFGFKVARYDRSLPLTIDPVLTYSTYLGGSGGEQSQGIAVDSQGSAYITGLTFSTDFPTTAGVAQNTCKSCSGSKPDAFVSKLNTNGTALVYSTYVGGSDYDQPAGIAVDSNGNAVVGGYTWSVDFPLLNNNPTWGTLTGTGPQTHGFLFSLNATGTAFNFSTYIAGSGSESVTGVATDSNGNIFAVGTTNSPNFPVTPGALTASPAYPLNDIFVMKFVPAGTLTFSALIAPTKKSTSAWANSLFASGVAVDSSDDIFITGWGSDGFPTTTGSYQPASNGNPNAQTYNAFVAKLDPAASQILAATYLGGSSQDEAKAIAVDGNGNAYIAGTANSTNFPVTPGAYETSMPKGLFGNPCCASFVAKFDPTLATLQYSTFLTGAAGADFTTAFAIAVDGAGQAIVTGETHATDFPLVNPVISQPAAGQFGSVTAFLTQFNSAGSALLFSTYYGGSTGSHGIGVALDGSNAAYITGTTNDTDLPTTTGAFQPSVPPPPQFVSANHAYVAKIDISAPGPSLCPSATTLNFNFVRVGTASQPKTLTVNNCGNAALSVASVVAGGDFTETDNCTTAAVSPGNSCTVQVTFKPTAEALRTATLLIASNTGVTTRVALSGTGAQPHVGFLSGTGPITFDSMLIGITSPVARTVIVSNVGTATLTITGMTTTGDFAETNSCPQTLFPHANCLVTLNFTPTVAGLRTGAFTVASDDPNGPATVALSGTGYDAYPAPTITSISPNSAAAGTSNLQLTVNGANFFPASVIQINGVDHATTYQSGNWLSTNLTASDLASMSEVQVTVATPAPGGGAAPPAILTVYLSLPITAAGFTFDPYSRRLFAAVPSGATNYANSVVPIDPFTGTVGTGVQIGNDPAKTVISNDGHYLYVALNGDHAVERYDIGKASTDIQIGMPSDPTFGQLRARELAVVPNDSHSFLATLQRSSSEGGIALFTDSVLRTLLPNDFPTNAGPDTVRFMSDSSVAWGLENGNWLMKFGLGTSGLTLASTQINSAIGGQIESDGTYLYSNFGPVYDPVHQTLVGKYTNLNAGGSVVPDTPLQRTFFFSFDQVYAYDQSSFAQLGTITIGHNVGSSTLARWGSDGFALAMVDIFGDHTNDSIAIFRSRFARPNANTTLTPTMGSTSPATQMTGSGNFLMTITGTNFVAGAVAMWNSTELTTKFVSGTTLTAYVSNSDISQPGTVQVTVKNPNGSTTGAANFTVTSNISLSTSTLSLGSQLLGVSSSGQSVTITNNGSATLNITGITASNGFTQTNNCSSLATAATCSVTITFQPTAAGAVTGVLTIAASDGETLMVGLSGSATDFGVAAAGGSSTSANIKAGQTATFNLAVSPVSGFTGNVALSCSGAPALSQCGVAPTNVAVGSGPAAFTVTLTTTAPVVAMQLPSAPMAPPNGGVVLLALTAIAGIAAIRRARLRPAFVTLVACVALMPGCGGGGGGTKPPGQNPQPGTPAGAYAITVTATTQGVSRQMTLNVTVQ